MQKLNELLKSICRLSINEIGCFYLKNYGLPKNLISQVFAQAKWFFALPQEEKNQIALVPGTNCGYVGRWNERNLNESLMLSTEIFPEKVGIGSDAIEAPIQWLKGQTEFREVLWQSFTACHSMGLRVLQAFAIALKLPETYFTDLHSQQNHHEVLHYYPALVQPPKPEQTRFDDHTDWGSITFLFQNGEGLKVYTNTGEWILAPAIPDTVLVMIANLMQRWTNDKLSATKHGVSNPSEFHSANERYSLAYLLAPNYNAEITCIESCLGANESPKYAPILTSEYYNLK